MLGFGRANKRPAENARSAPSRTRGGNRGVRVLMALSVGLSAVLIPVVPAPFGPAQTASAQPSSSGPHVPCSGVHDGDERWGPEHLPRPWQEPVGPLLDGYSRSGDLAPAEFLDTYWDPAANSWKYPPQDGFDVRPDGSPDKEPELLEVGDDLDRFGSEYGSFLAPAGDDYAERSLPPQSLTTREADFPCGYHRYEVARPFTVWEGPIAPWFAQPGGGTQILLDSAFLQPDEGQRLNVRWLLSNGYLKPADDLR
ncbi:TNT domain-containing protein [Saccharopolyspora gloriosae]|uniref:TNT domain-containing protein n=1 Tax=Saccharopolyspora gloriosae TaxID=455344 RepID=UPI001FB6D835|nr:TNT domain-containing protein [Saccharopolyspora gloriosae]